MPDAPRPPLDSLREAFDRLATPDKAAFVLEATFDTIGQAIAETGRLVADAVSSFSLDDAFQWAPPARPEADTAEAPTDAAAAAAAAAATGAPPPKRAARGRRGPGTPPSDGPPAR